MDVREEEESPPPPRPLLRAILIVGFPWVAALLAGTLSYFTGTYENLPVMGLGWLIAVAGAATGGFLIDSWPLIKFGAGIAGSVFGTAIYMAVYDFSYAGMRYIVEGLQNLV